MTAPRLDLTGYPETLAEILRELPLAALGPGKPVIEMRDRLASLAESVFGTKDRDLARACKAGLWLAFDFLDESHQISQSLETPEGSYWHAIMHRREPDYWNSKYWWRRVGTHPVFAPLAEEAARLAAGAAGRALFLTNQSRWDAEAFVDLCEASADVGSACHELCLQVQRVEWELLFAWCYRRATS